MEAAAPIPDAKTGLEPPASQPESTEDKQPTPLDYMLEVMRDPAADAARRDRMAIAAAPFMHPRKEPVGQGKREKAEKDAADAAGGRFGARAAPLKLVKKG